MFSLNRNIISESIKKTIKKATKPKKIIQNIKVKMFCNFCNGTGYHVIQDTIVVCSVCSGTGMKHYTYF
tara:strand:- start:1646 stop:1852 length:207 start_codon:yes stop_codon:yes gene_type:complete